MGTSPLDFANSEKFRKDILVKNLKPYNKSPYPATGRANYEYVQSMFDVKDSPDSLIDTPIFANQLYPLNQYGNEGGYKQVPDPNALLNTKSNEGEYGYQDATIVDQAYPESKKWKSSNKYSSGSELPIDGAPFISSDESPMGYTSGPNNQPYPSSFVPSSYSPLSILLNPDPQGSDGLLSQDSYLVKLGAFTLRKEFQDRIAAQIYQDTVGRANVFSVDSATDILNIITGKVPLIQPNWAITVPENPVLAATNFILRLGGSILPVSPIPGSYFDESALTRQSTTIQQTGDAFRQSFVGNLLTSLAGTDLTGSEIFYNNTGAGQKGQLFKNIDYNKYKPSFDRTVFNRLAGAIVGSTTDNSNYYVGSRTSDPGMVASPPGDIPTNEYGQAVGAPVYGPDAMAKLYEPISNQIKLGANGPAYIDGGGIEGGFTWVSPKYKGNAGKKVGKGGEITNEDEDFKPSSYNSTESTNLEFREGSILYDTQKLIDSQPQGGKRLQHVGNAIDQVSKVFNDGYKELTKGSRVLAYVGDIGQEVGTEYCRVFAKDIPYLQYNDLQKTDGVVNNGRRFSYSVFDKTYNLNIAPNKQEGGQSSSNLINGPGGTSTNVAYAKKYMFSLENLAWRTSSTPGYTTADLPICERGPNGGRVMWFPPYGLTFSETISPTFKQTEFIGRPEPIYTYQSTTRTGSLSWKIVVDHPSVLNLIVNKVLGNETNKTRIDSIITSFFAGCRKYDLYELAKKYYTVNPNDLFQLQQIITSKEVSVEGMEFIKKTIQTGNDSPTGVDQQIAPVFNQQIFDQFEKLSFYFGNDYPKSMGENYVNEFNRYTGTFNRNYYANKPNAEQTTNFFDTVVIPNFQKITGFTTELAKVLEQTDGSVTIRLTGSCSAPASIAYNLSLADRRLDSVQKWFESLPNLQPFFKAGRILISKEPDKGEQVTVEPIPSGSGSPSKRIYCSDTKKDGQVVGGDTVGSKDVFTYNAMACRAVLIGDIDASQLKYKPAPVTPAVVPEPQYQEVLQGKVVTGTKKVESIEQKYVNKDNITKRILRLLLSECDYFETIKEETPMVFDNLKDQLKFFSPAFHSITPEGLNSRLTFLQQCTRPGDTIPTIKDVDGAQTLQYNNATNTAFGTPPVLVLRVGDFFHTKIIPTSLSLQYESLDLNPEGIGVQPMIANVTMGFNFVGGQGLKNSIDKLQNALSFNYYANTEMWDDRADVSDDSYKVLDKQFLNDLNIVPPPAVNQSPPTNGQSNGSSIGAVLSSNVEQYVTGNISYSTFMDVLKNDAQNYFRNIIAKQKECVNQYNNAVRQVWQAQRNYFDGRFYLSMDRTKIFGKPENIQQRTDAIFVGLKDEISNGTDVFITFMSSASNNFSSKAIRQLKENYTAFVSNKQGTFINALTKINQDLTNQQQSYVATLGKVNTITYDPGDGRGTDGYQQPNGNVIVYVLSGGTVFENLKTDIRKVRDAMDEFNVQIESSTTFTHNGVEYTGKLAPPLSNNGKQEDYDLMNVFTPFSKNIKFDDKNFRKQYMILSDEILDDKKYNTFKNAMIGNIIGNTTLLGTSNFEIEKVFDLYWITQTKPLFSEENAITISFIDKLEKDNLKNYLNFTPYETKERILGYSTEPVSEAATENQKLLIKGLGGTAGQNGNKLTWNDELANEVFISKLKFN